MNVIIYTELGGRTWESGLQAD